MVDDKSSKKIKGTSANHVRLANHFISSCLLYHTWANNSAGVLFHFYTVLLLSLSESLLQFVPGFNSVVKGGG